jgi:exonuclease VII large subunit
MTTSEETTTTAQENPNGSDPDPQTGSDPLNPAESLATAAHGEVDFNTLSKIRDLLFGQQIRNQEQRLDQLEQRLDQACADLREQTNQRLQVLEISLRTELQTLRQQLQANHQSQTLAITQLEDNLTALGLETSHKQEELKTLLMDEIQVLQRVDIDNRNHLASLFSELAVNLRVDS